MKDLGWRLQMEKDPPLLGRLIEALIDQTDDGRYKITTKGYRVEIYNLNIITLGVLPPLHMTTSSMQL